MNDLRSRLIKEFKLASEGELQAIIDRGQEKDGTAARIAAKNTTGVAKAKYANDMALMQMDSIVGAGVARSVADANKWRPTPFQGRSFDPLGPFGSFVATKQTNTIHYGTPRP